MEFISQLINEKLRWWQLFYLFQFSMVTFLSSSQHLAMPFYAPEIDHWCSPPDQLSKLNQDQWLNYSIPTTDDDSHEHQKCRMYDVDYKNVTVSDYEKFMEEVIKQNKSLETKACDHWQYSRNWKKTIVSDWNLVCKRSVLVSTSSAVYMGGMMTGAFVLSQLSDRYGRRLVYLWSLAFWFISGIILPFSPGYVTFSVLRFFIATFDVSCITISFVLSQESLTCKQRASWGNYATILFSVSILVNTGLFYFLRTWTIVQIIWTIPVLLLFLLELLGPESPRWLLSVGRYEDALVVVKKIAQKNKVSLPDESVLRSQIENEKNSTKNWKETKATILDLFKTPEMRIKTLVCYFLWFTTAFCYFAFSLNTGDLVGNLFINMTISGCLEIVGVFLSTFCIMKFGRRITTVWCLLLAGAFLLLSIPVPDSLQWLKLGMLLIGRTFVSMTFCVIYIYTGEIMPTVLRSVGVGSSSTIARVGAILAPYCREIAEVSTPEVPFIIYGVMCILSGLSALRLHETLNQQHS